MLILLVLAGRLPLTLLFPLVGAPTWEISARMIPRYCLPCPRASMAAKNSFLSCISFTTAQRGGAITAQDSGSAQGPRHAWSLRDTGCLSSYVALLLAPTVHTHTHRLTFIKPVQLRSWVFLPNVGNLSPFLHVFPSGKDILESSFLLLQISCGGQKQSC